MKRTMQIPIKTTAAATNLVTSREQLAQFLHENHSLIERVVSCPGAFYTEFTVPKADGELRTIRPPRKQLRALQRLLLQLLYDRVRIPFYLHGGLPRRSIFTHAQAHVGRAMVATLDIQKFFPSTSAAHVLPVLDALGFRDGALQDVLALTLLDDQLPQGSPTSSLLANLAFLSGDQSFIEICRKRHLHFSRYVDDIAVSGGYQFDELRGPFVECIEKAGYSVADSKVHFVPSSRQQVVTGLITNSKLRPTPEFTAELKQTIRLCLELGARKIADSEGIGVLALKAQLTGKVAHLMKADPLLGKKFRGMMCGVNWSLQWQEVTSDIVSP